MYLVGPGLGPQHPSLGYRRGVSTRPSGRWQDSNRRPLDGPQITAPLQQCLQELYQYVRGGFGEHAGMSEQ